MSEFTYVGSELDLFAAVHNWKSYWSKELLPYIAGDVLEVGAGIGSNTLFLDMNRPGRWVCLEPDPKLSAQLAENVRQGQGRRERETVCGTLQSLGLTEKFDTIIYIDVLEHIENDKEELLRAALRLRRGGRIIVLSPAHQRLFTPFDAAIGHFRRYNCRMLRDISPATLRLERLLYLDSVGLFLSMSNLFLRQSMPTKKQLRVWDRWVIPISRIVDKCTFHAVGKSIVGIWRLEESAEQQ